MDWPVVGAVHCVHPEPSRMRTGDGTALAPLLFP